MEKLEAKKQFLTNLFRSQKLAVIATSESNQPYTSLMAFASTEDLKYLLFATEKNTRKYKNMITNPRIAALIDNRSNRDIDIDEAVAVTVTGVVEEMHDLESEALKMIYLEKNPTLKDFLQSPKSVLLRCNVRCYYLVSRFQEIIEIPVT